VENTDSSMTTPELVAQLPLDYLIAIVMGTFMRAVNWFFDRVGRIGPA